MTLNLKFDLDPEFFRENECHHRIPRGRFSLKSMFAAVAIVRFSINRTGTIILWG